MNHYEEKLERRRERYEVLADKARRRSAAAFQRSHDIVGGIPMGQPVLVGHHSEKRHRAALNRSDNAMRRGCEAGAKAEHYADKAAGVGKAGISSDDPEALAKLRDKLQAMQARQERMKQANADWRKAGNKRGRNAAGEYIEPPYTYELTNNNGNMKRVKERIATLKEAPVESKTIEYDGVTLIHDADENRVKLVFPGKPTTEVRARLKGYGFRWSPTNLAWQRQLNAAGIYAAEEIAKEFAII